MVTDQTQARRRLDDRFRRLRPIASDPRPHRGWIRAIRDALGMSTAELGARMGVIQQGISEFERGEIHGTIKLETLRRAADALDCDLVYVLLPRTSLDEAVHTQARRKALSLVRPVAHHSRLEDQSISDDATTAQLDELTNKLIDRRGLWSEARTTP